MCKYVCTGTSCEPRADLESLKSFTGMLLDKMTIVQGDEGEKESRNEDPRFPVTKMTASTPFSFKQNDCPNS